ncbi:hypothetical protein HPB48_010600 [Haemaphysalis longicornis]|uniref:Uncharacterized protein n=1 Tax=Haemaphysalis longicornis TaxID=44386 RepID=A0A9J6FI08_HAELO|nr:hypothetical protein HPB48_010600 [Haemaphysalis longicornis]
MHLYDLHSTPPSQLRPPVLKILDTPLTQTTKIKLLVSPSTQTLLQRTQDATIARARRLFAFSQRATSSAGPVALRTLFTALVLPVGVLCPCVLPHQASRVARLTSVQRRAAFAILKRSSPPDRPYRDYRTPELLRAVGWQPLAQRYDAASLGCFWQSSALSVPPTHWQGIFVAPGPTTWPPSLPAQCATRTPFFRTW